MSDVSLVSGCVTLRGFFRLFFVVVDCVSMCWAAQFVVWSLWIVLGCLGWLRLFKLFWAALGCVGCFGLLAFRVVLDCLGCWVVSVCVWLCYVAGGCLDSSCSGSFGCFRKFWVVFHSFHFFEVDLYFVFVFLRQFGCLKLFHDVSHCFGCF